MCQCEAGGSPSLAGDACSLHSGQEASSLRAAVGSPSRHDRPIGASRSLLERRSQPDFAQPSPAWSSRRNT